MEGVGVPMGPLAVLPGLCSRSGRALLFGAGVEEEFEAVFAPPPRAGTTEEDLFFRLEAYSLRDIFLRCCDCRLATLGLGLGCLTSLEGGGRRGVEAAAPAVVVAAPTAEDAGMGEEMFVALSGATRLEGVAAVLAVGAVADVGVTAVSVAASTSAFV